MQLTDCTASLAETAAAIGRKPEWLRRNWRRLVDVNGFPRPLPGSALYWSRRLLELWLTTGGVVGGEKRRPANDDAPPAPDDDPAAGLVAAQKKSLTERYAGRS